MNNKSNYKYIFRNIIKDTKLLNNLENEIQRKINGK